MRITLHKSCNWAIFTQAEYAWVYSVARCSDITSFFVLRSTTTYIRTCFLKMADFQMLWQIPKKTKKIQVKLFRVHVYVKTMYFWFHKNSHDAGGSLGILLNLLWAYQFGCDVFRGVLQSCTREGEKFRDF